MKKLLAQKQTFQKFRPYELTYKKRNDKPGQMILTKLYIEKLGAHLVHSVLDNNNWNIIYDKKSK